MSNKKNISFKLLNIKTEEFATFDYENSLDVNEIRTDLQFGVDPNIRLVNCKMKFQFLFEKNPVVIIAVSCNFEIEEESWKDAVALNNKINLPKHLLEHLAIINVGTSRGVLHAKTENTSYNNIVIPTINVTELVEKDIIFDN